MIKPCIELLGPRDTRREKKHALVQVLEMPVTAQLTASIERHNPQQLKSDDITKQGLQVHNRITKLLELSQLHVMCMASKNKANLNKDDIRLDVVAYQHEK